jgi:tetratricopeptide (TPR) repeat protein
MPRSQLSLAIALIGFMPLAAAAAGSLVGQPVFLKSTARPRVGSQEVDPNLIALPATVGAENGDWLWIGSAWIRRSDALTAQEALAYYSEQVRKNPADAAGWSNRAAVHSAAEDYSAAIKDIGEAIRLDPRSSDAFANRGWARAKMGDYRSAIEDLSQALKLNPNNGLALGNSAWIRATAYDKAYRNGAKAVANATRANELSGGKDWNDADTLAAAYAEKGDKSDFEQAIRWATKALELAPAAEKPKVQARLESYQAGSPFRDKPSVDLPMPSDAVEK